MSIDLNIKGDIEVLRLQPGDVLVVTLARPLHSEALRRIPEQLKERFPDHEVIVVTDNLRLSVQREEVPA